MISYLTNPQGDVVWKLLNPQGKRHQVGRIPLCAYLEILAHTKDEAEFRAALWLEVKLEQPTVELWKELEREEVFGTALVLKAKILSKPAKAGA